MQEYLIMVEHLGLFGTIWDHLEPNETVWDHFERVVREQEESKERVQIE